MAIGKKSPLAKTGNVSCSYSGLDVEDLKLNGKFLILSASDYVVGTNNPVRFKLRLDILGDITYIVLDFDDFVAEKVTADKMCSYIEKLGIDSFINLSEYKIDYNYFGLNPELENLSFNNGDFSIINLKDGCELRFKDGYTMDFNSYGAFNSDDYLRTNKYFDLDFDVSEEYSSTDSEWFTLDNFYFTPSKEKFIINVAIYEYDSGYNCRPEELPGSRYGNLRIVYDMVTHKFTKIEVKDWRGNKINSKVKYKYKG